VACARARVHVHGCAHQESHLQRRWKCRTAALALRTPVCKQRICAHNPVHHQTHTHTTTRTHTHTHTPTHIHTHTHTHTHVRTRSLPRVWHPCPHLASEERTETNRLLPTVLISGWTLAAVAPVTTGSASLSHGSAHVTSSARRVTALRGVSPLRAPPRSSAGGGQLAGGKAGGRKWLPRRARQPAGGPFTARSGRGRRGSGDAWSAAERPGRPLQREQGALGALLGQAGRLACVATA